MVTLNCRNFLNRHKILIVFISFYFYCFINLLERQKLNSWYHYFFLFWFVRFVIFFFLIYIYIERESFNVWRPLLMITLYYQTKTPINLLGIKNHYSSPAHPQANGQVEVTNWSLLKIINTWLEGAKGIWPEELPSMLWAYRTTVRTPTGETPFRLAYGSKAVISAEVGFTSYRVGNHDERKNDDAMHLQLDLVDEVRATAKQRLAWFQDLMARHYNSKVRHRDFKVGDLVLRKVMSAARDPTQGKLGPNWEGSYRITSWQRKDTYHLETLDGRKLHHPWNTKHLRKYYQ